MLPQEEGSNCQELWISSWRLPARKASRCRLPPGEGAVGSGSQAARDLGVARSVVEGARRRMPHPVWDVVFGEGVEALSNEYASMVECQIDPMAIGRSRARVLA